MIRKVGLFLRQLLEILGRFLVEVGAALLAAELDLLSFVEEDDRLTHFTKLVVGDDAGLEGVWFRSFLFRLDLRLPEMLFPWISKGGGSSKDDDGRKSGSELILHDLIFYGVTQRQ